MESNSDPRFSHVRASSAHLGSSWILETLDLTLQIHFIELFIIPSQLPSFKIPNSLIASQQASDSVIPSLFLQQTSNWRS